MTALISFVTGFIIGGIIGGFIYLVVAYIKGLKK